MDHLHTVLNGDLDDLVTRKISTNGGVLSALANDVRLIGLYSILSAPHSLSVENASHRTHELLLCRCMLRRSS